MQPTSRQKIVRDAQSVQEAEEARMDRLFVLQKTLDPNDPQHQEIDELTRRARRLADEAIALIQNRPKPPAPEPSWTETLLAQVRQWLPV